MNITNEALKEFNYNFGIQVGIMVQALAMHWDNQVATGKHPYTGDDFRKLFEENAYVLTHNGVLSNWIDKA